jgi:hypothetical protein
MPSLAPLPSYGDGRFPEVDEKFFLEDLTLINCSTRQLERRTLKSTYVTLSYV